MKRSVKDAHLAIAIVARLAVMLSQLCLLLLTLLNHSAVGNNLLKDLNWIKGVWRAEYTGKVFWPTIPTMTFGEELVIQEAPTSLASGMQFFNFSARAWSHTTKDHLHDEWGFLTIDPSGKVVLMTTGNNGFSTYEEGNVTKDTLKLTLSDIGRVSFSRDLPVKALERTFTLHKPNLLEQRQRMRTTTHPTSGLLDHAVVVYTKVG